MSSIRVRPLRRSDRDQLTQLVNAHAGAVIPGMGVSVAAVLAALERQPGEFIEDPWVSERVTLVAQQQDRIAAAAHLLRYFSDERAGNAARDVGEIRWFLFWPHAPAGNPCWPDATEAAQALINVCVRQLENWHITQQRASGDLPVRGVYGVPEQWPHIRAAYERAGFAHTGHTEIVYLATVADLARTAQPPIAGLSLSRSVGMNGTRLSAVLGREAIGYIEVETFEEGERQPRHAGWADIGNLHVAEAYRRRGVARWLLGQAADWLLLAGVGRVLDYAWLDGPDALGLDYTAYRAFLDAAGFREVTRTRRGWTRTPEGGPSARLAVADPPARSVTGQGAGARRPGATNPLS
ncbi:MAG TPA: GNAT family N-acetyltransferase [Streptosporangiaceae bacterium]|nr:GNAT family N-acetyltransferase [Streptosporangiaceae bacterium]